MQGLQTARILAGHDIPVIGLASDMTHHACRTNVCRQILRADTNSEALIDTLVDLADGLPAKSVLYPCHDQCVWLISCHRSQLEKQFHIMLADPQVVEMLMEKDSFYEFAAGISIEVPQTSILRNRNDAELIAADLPYPCVVKPVRRSPQWNARTLSKAFRVNDANEFLDVYDNVNGWAPELMVQQWIVGDDTHLYSCNCYFDRQSRLVTTFIARKIRQWPPHMGSSCYGEECRNDVVLEASVRIFNEAGYCGLGYIEMKQDARTGVHYAIEANVGRPTGRSAIAEAGGVEMLLAMYCDATGRPLPDNLTQRYRGAKWIDIRHDFQSAIFDMRNGELKFRDWVRSLVGRKAHAVFSWKDPMPFLADIRKAVSIAMSSTERARRNHSTVPGPVASVPEPRNIDEKEKL